MDTWVAHGGQRYGPYTQEQLREMLGSGQIAPSAQVWVPETSQWINAQELPGYRRPGTADPFPNASGWSSPAAPGASGAPLDAAPLDPPVGYGGESYPDASSSSPSSPYAAAPYSAVAGTDQLRPSETNNTAIAALVLGILGLLSIVLLITVFLAPVPVALSILAVVLGFVARSQNRRTGQRGTGMAISGIVLGFVSLALTAALVVLAVVGIAMFSRDAATYGLSRACSEAVRTDLRNAATAQETVFLDQQQYTRSVAELQSNGFVSAAGPINCVTEPLTVVRATNRDFCMQMAGGGSTWSISKEGLRSGPCTGTTAEGAGSVRPVAAA